MLNHSPKPKSKTANQEQRRTVTGNNLYLFVRPAVRSFVYLYTHSITKKRIKKKIGEHPHLSLADAREITRGYNQFLAKGFDPFEFAELQEKERAKQEISLLEFAQQWKRLKLATQENSTATMAREWRRLEKHLFPAFGSRPLKELAIFELVDYFFLFNHLKVVEKWQNGQDFYSFSKRWLKALQYKTLSHFLATILSTMPNLTLIF
ncbi:hypothetical protein A1D29_02095 [Pasteurellaceae bacterium Orientalotternb1]|nr:hypothetical protein A1D29_02095 [Pasteurellaceae bacterium Orientalotternb1]